MWFGTYSEDRIVGTICTVVMDAGEGKRVGRQVIVIPTVEISLK